MSMASPVQTPRSGRQNCRLPAAPSGVVAVHSPVAGRRRAPELSIVPAVSCPPQTIISVPVQTAAWYIRPGIGGPSPHDHLPAGPDGGALGTGTGRPLRAHGPPGIGLGIIERAVVVIIKPIEVRPPAPDNHLATVPDGGVKPARRGSALDCGGSPRVGRRNIAAARVEKEAIDTSAPEDQLTPRPDRGMRCPRARNW